MSHKKKNHFDGYTLVDSGDGRKLERFGSRLISRPAAQALWKPQLTEQEWHKADISFTRESEQRWQQNEELPETWNITVEEVTFKLSMTDFGHLGIFPEQRDSWRWIQETISSAIVKQKDPIRVLNLFAYSGGSTLAAAKAGAHVCHLDASKGMVSWARENAKLNNLETAPIRWIIDDVNKFLAREERRKSQYEAIILDPPSFGRGSKGEVFKIEEEIVPLLRQCSQLLSDRALFVLFSCHTPGFTPCAMNHLLTQAMQNFSKESKVESGEMVLSGDNNTFTLPSGTYARWVSHELS